MKKTVLLAVGFLTSFGPGFYINSIITKQPVINIDETATSFYNNKNAGSLNGLWQANEKY